MNILRKISRRSHVYLLPALLIILASYQVERLQIAETPKKIVLPRPVRHNLEQLDVDEIIEACTHPKVIPNTPFKFKMDVEDKSTGRRTIMEEVGVYTVKNGRIVQEEFMYGAMLPAESAMPQVLQKL